MALSKTNDSWRHVPCNCSGCTSINSVVPVGRTSACLKKKAYEEILEQQGYARFEGSASREVQPASAAQIKKWRSWILSEWFAAANERRISLEAEARTAYGTEKFDPTSMEKFLDNYVPEEEHLEYMSTNLKWIAYEAFGKEQRKLLKFYESVKTDEDYDEAEEAYKALQSHVNTHGQLIREMPGREHKRPANTSVVPTQMGRRAARRAAQV